jgi:hypothetical protein
MKFISTLCLLLATWQSFAQTNLITNGGFENFSQGWILEGPDVQAEMGLCDAHSGDSYLWFGDNEELGLNNAYGGASAYVTVPSNAISANFNFYASVVSDEEDQVNVWDVMYFDILDANDNFIYSDSLDNTYANLLADDCDGWFAYGETEIPAMYFGQTLTFEFYAFTDESFPTIFRIDDVSVTATLSTGTAELNALPSTQIRMREELKQLYIQQAVGLNRTVTIYNTLGQEVHSSNLNQEVNTIDLNALASGVYLVQIPGEAAQRIRL